MSAAADLSQPATIAPAGEFQLVWCDSLEKVYGPAEPRPHALGAVVLPRGGVGSFQIAVRPRPGWSPGHVGGAVPEVSQPDGIMINSHAVDFVPAPLTASVRADEFYDHTGPALLPDVLRPLAPGEGLPLVQGQWRALWFTVHAADAVGQQSVTISLHSEHTGEPIGTVTVPIVVVDADLPQSPISVTQWFHVDGLAQYYGTEPYSPYGWQLIERFTRSALDSGSTSLLTPIHTPPLDTAIGTRRLDVGLVGVHSGPDGYTFDMGRFETWLAMARRTGVRELEMAHLFSQWGGECAPNIDDVTGRQLFGWHTDSLDPEYQRFLADYVPAVRRVLDRAWGGQVFWHLTDEPHAEHADRYRALKGSVEPLLRDELITDALSNVELWTSGLVDPPIIATDHAQPFLDAGIERPWLYYCTSQSQRVANRFIGLPSYRNRVLGSQLFKYDSRGFLQWGFNFWNTQLSRRPLNPFVDTTSGHGFQAGDAFIVYPGEGGIPWESIRFRVFREAMDDVKLFTALAERRGREHVANLLGLDRVTLTDYPRDPGHYLSGHAAALQQLAD
ncbi:DUF4091 domain-containing protein [Propionibacteriaceae bacterium Y2011]